MMDILAKNLLILASAGSGKTYQLGNRIIGLVARGVAPERIVALTFTRKAAGEFADSVLTQLAQAAGNPDAAAQLRHTLSLPDADFSATLECVVRALPRFTLGTMDGFFSKVVRSFQYELGLTGGKFDLLEGARAAAMADDLLAEILGDALVPGQRDEFFHAFRRATYGREDTGVLSALRAFVNVWHARFRENRELTWGPATLVDVGPEVWPQQKSALAARVRAGLDDITYTRKGQREALELEITRLENHRIGGGSLGSQPSSLLQCILKAAASPPGPLTLKFYKEFILAAPAGDALRSLVNLAARCELAAALQRTRAVRDLVALYDALCEQRLRHKGLLGFNDVKILMGAWAHHENARLQREQVDFRLDARIDHWLLDEFQDTSRADWAGLLPLIDEAASDSDSTIFIVGDRKQAIYAWRGGDVRLFDEVIERYHGGLDIAPMAESWRSCPEVLELVNHVCGDGATLRELFGTSAGRWDWQDHLSAAHLTGPQQRGQARLEVVGDWDSRLERLEEILRELGVGQRAMTCGILLRGNEKVGQVAGFLRARGFDVIEEGRRQPAKDHPLGIAIAGLLDWLADPADQFAREVLEMSPMAGILRARHGHAWPDIWNALSTTASQIGFAGMTEELMESWWPDWSDFGRCRAGDLLAALTDFDVQGGVSPREAAAWVARLEVAQSPGVAAVQVMTIHKAKGLGFDVVILPEVPDDPVPLAQHFDVAEGPGWLTQTPPQWARALVPELQEAEACWASNQQYEAFCTLYVALTRARRGLYVLLHSPASSADPDKPSLANWLARSTRADGRTGVVYQNGEPGWVESIPMLDPEPPPQGQLTPGAASPRRGRLIPSQSKRPDSAGVVSTGGMQFGTEVHALLEQIAWVDETPQVMPGSAAGQAVSALLENPVTRGLFEKNGRRIELLREQTAVAIIDGQFLSGVIDRLHLHRSPEGRVTRVEIIDFKTDAVKTPEALSDRHAGQMAAYRTALEAIYPNVQVTCILVSVRHAVCVEL